MNSRLIARGFINGLRRHGDRLYAEVMVQNGKQYIPYRPVVDSGFAERLLGLADPADIAKGFEKRPVMLCVLNPHAVIRGGEIEYTGVLNGFTDYSIYASGNYDKSLFLES